MPVHRGVILQPTYRIHRDHPIIQLYGRLESGRAFLVEDDRFRPYFFVRARDGHQLAGESGVTLRETELSNLAGEPVSRISVQLPGEAGVYPGAMLLFCNLLTVVSGCSI